MGRSLAIWALVLVGYGCSSEDSGGGPASSLAGAGQGAGSAGASGQAGKGGSSAAGSTSAGGAGGTSSAGGGPVGGSGVGGNEAQCGITTNRPDCDACLLNSCCAVQQACVQDGSCIPLAGCVSNCSNQTCANQCGAKYPAGVEHYNALVGCLQGSCAQPCAGDSQGGAGSTGQAGSTGSAGSTGGPSDDDAQYCVDRINKYRATLGLPPLQRWAEAEVCSDGEAASDAASGTPHGAFGKCGESAQNECPGWSGPNKAMLDGCLEVMWNEGPGQDFQKHGHYINMSSQQFTRVACGFAVGSNGSYWSVQNFQ